MSQFILLTAAAALTAKPPQPGDWSFGWLAVGAIANVALAITVCAWIIINYYSIHRQRNSNSPWQLFADLCKAHKLSRLECQTLRRLAQHHRLEQPAMLFVEPSWFSLEKIGLSWGHRDQLDKLRLRLFAAH